MLLWDLEDTEALGHDDVSATGRWQKIPTYSQTSFYGHLFNTVAIILAIQVAFAQS